MKLNTSIRFEPGEALQDVLLQVALQGRAVVEDRLVLEVVLQRNRLVLDVLLRDALVLGDRYVRNNRLVAVLARPNVVRVRLLQRQLSGVVEVDVGLDRLREDRRGHLLVVLDLLVLLRLVNSL